MRAARSSAVVLTAVLALAGCAGFPQAPPTLPATFIPHVEPSRTPDGTFVSADGFTAVERISMRLRVETCTQFSNGSAWVLDENTLVTNRHVVEGAQRIEATTYDGRDFVATSSVYSDFADLALVEFDAEFTEFATISTEGPSTGDVLSIVGYPEGSRLHTESGAYRGSVPDTLGTDQDWVYVLQASVKPGNSGSPVTNEAGEVVGVLYAGDDFGESLVVKLSSLQNFLADESTHIPNNKTC